MNSNYVGFKVFTTVLDDYKNSGFNSECFPCKFITTKNEFY